MFLINLAGYTDFSVFLPWLLGGVDVLRNHTRVGPEWHLWLSVRLRS